MNRLKSVFSIYLMFGFVLFGIAAQADGQTRRNEREIRDITRNLSSKIDDFRYSLTYQLRNNSADRQEIEDVSNDLAELQKTVRAFSDNLDRRRENRDDVSAILDASRQIDFYLQSNSQNRRIQSDWAAVQNLLTRLASYYNISSNQGGGTSFPDDRDNYPSGSYNRGLTGTYRLDVSRSENTQEIVDNSHIRGSENAQDLEDKLEAPEELAIDIRGNQVTLASSKAAPVTFTADGTTRTDNSSGRTIRLRAALRGDQLTISSLGGETDYTITFVSTDNGRSLKVTRRITTDYLAQTVFADSVYNKTDSVARLGIGGTSPDDDNYSSNDPDDRYPNTGVPTATGGRRGTYIVPNGTMITGILENDIDTKVSQNNDRFRMTVQSPDQFRGATVEGYLTGINRSGKVSGRSQITFNFERITLRNGETYDFAGNLQSVTDANGKTVKVGAEGEAKGGSQTKETIKRGGIGAGAGAIIGAIIGGGKGAAIGAIIGGGAGAGSVIVQGKDDLELKQGSTVTVQSSSPLR